MAIITVMDNLSFGDIGVCGMQTGDIAFVHACKEPCHRKACGYAQKSLPKEHPHYLWMEKGHHLYLNLIDPPVPLFQKESFARFLSFVDRQIRERPVVIHCNKGESRAPSLALFYMAKRGHLPGESYRVARAAFEERFPYKPGKGIETFLTEHWDEL